MALSISLSSKSYSRFTVRVSGIRGSTVYCYLDGVPGSTQSESGVTSTTFTFTLLSPETTYTVCAYDGIDDVELSVTTDAEPEPDPSLSVTFGTITANSITISSITATDFTPVSYEIYWRKTSEEKSSTSGTITSSSIPYPITGLTAGTTYAIRVKGTNSSGTIVWEPPESSSPFEKSTLAVSSGTIIYVGGGWHHVQPFVYSGRWHTAQSFVYSSGWHHA